MNVIEKFQSLISPAKPTLRPVKESASTTTIKDMLSSAGQGRFLRDIYGDELLTPHREMEKCVKMFNTDAYVAAGVQTMVDFIMGAEQMVVADDPATEKTLNNFLKNTNFFRPLREVVENFVRVGNGYFEVTRAEENGLILRFYPIERADKMWIQADDKGYADYYVLELSMQTKYEGATYYTIYYLDRIPNPVYGLKICKKDIIHFPLGFGDVPWYGRADIASGINIWKIKQELERDLAVIARYKAIPKKWINIKGTNQPTVDNISAQISAMNDNVNPITGLKDDPTVIDLSYAGKDMNLDPYLNYCKRQLTASLAPEFVLHGEDTNRATAREQRSAYMLRIRARRDVISTKIEKEILIPTAELLGLKNISGLKFVFSDFDYQSEDEMREEALKQFQIGIITLNESRVMLGLEEIAGGDVFSWEVTGQMQELESTAGESKKEKKDLKLDAKQSTLAPTTALKK